MKCVRSDEGARRVPEPIDGGFPPDAVAGVLLEVDKGLEHGDAEEAGGSRFAERDRRRRGYVHGGDEHAHEEGAVGSI